MSVFGAVARARTLDFEKGDVRCVPQSNPHYVENAGCDLKEKEVIRLRKGEDAHASRPRNVGHPNVRFDQQTTEQSLLIFVRLPLEADRNRG
jgi:oxalate decarboxylase/phosphoglucose isomerase-like protein (cupin superfamily)